MIGWMPLGPSIADLIHPLDEPGAFRPLDESGAFRPLVESGVSRRIPTEFRTTGPLLSGAREDRDFGPLLGYPIPTKPARGTPNLQAFETSLTTCSPCGAR
jgi:hypothetical protein